MFLIENGKLVDYNRNCRKSVLMSPEGVKEIDSCGFLDDHWVTELILPESLEIIGACAFHGCRFLEKIVFPKGLKRIEIDAFGRCNRLRKVQIPEGAEVDCGAFAHCTIDEVNFGNRVDFSNIHDSVLLKTSSRCILCHAPMELTDDRSRMHCTCCGQMFLLKDMEEWDSFGIRDKTCVDYFGYGSHIPDGVVKIAHRAFDDAVVPSVEFPDTVAEIEDEAFLWCKFGLNAVRLPRNLKRLEKKTFICCNLSRVHFPETLTYIGKECFAACENLKGIDIPNGVTYIGKAAFQDCISLSEVRFGPKFINIGADAFKGCRSLHHVTLPACMRHIDVRAVFDSHTEVSFE